MDTLSFLTQSTGKLAGLDLLIIALYMAMCLYIGFRKSGTIRNIKDFALGNGAFSTFVLICTIYATHLGAGMTFGTVEKIRETGMLFALSLLAFPLGWAVKIWVFGSNIQQFKGCLSQSDIMEKLYGPAGMWATNIGLMVNSVGVIAAQASAIGYLLYYYTGFSMNQSIMLGVGVLIIYSAVGGVRAGS